jgi:uncharacterized protein YbjT (DUF2867 family)
MAGPAFVFGATGFVGREVVRQLCVRGATAIAHVRPDSKSLDTWRARFTEMGASVDTTPWNAALLAARFKETKPAQLYICIGTTRKAAKRDQLEGNIYEQVDYGLTKVAVDAARASETQPRIVYLSSVGANRDASSAYLQWRGKAEDVVMDSGLPWAVARPSFIVGEREESRPAESVGATIGDGLLAIASAFGGKKLRARYRSISGDVLASALIRLGEQSDSNVLVDGDDLR